MMPLTSFQRNKQGKIVSEYKAHLRIRTVGENFHLLRHNPYLFTTETTPGYTIPGGIRAPATVAESSTLAEGITLFDVGTPVRYENGKLQWQPYTPGGAESIQGIRVAGFSVQDATKYYVIRGQAELMNIDGQEQYILDTLYEPIPGRRNDASRIIVTQGILRGGYPLNRVSWAVVYNPNGGFSNSNHYQVFINGIEIAISFRGASSARNRANIGDILLGAQTSLNLGGFSFDGTMWDVEFAVLDEAPDGLTLATDGRKFDDSPARLALIGKLDAEIMGKEINVPPVEEGTVNINSEAIQRGDAGLAENVIETSTFARGVTISPLPVFPPYSEGRIDFFAESVRAGGGIDVETGIEVSGLFTETSGFYVIRGGAALKSSEVGSPIRHDASTIFQVGEWGITKSEGNSAYSFNPANTRNDDQFRDTEDYFWALIIEIETGIGTFYQNGFAGNLRSSPLSWDGTTHSSVSLRGLSLFLGNLSNFGSSFDGEMWDVEVAHSDEPFENPEQLATEGRKFDFDGRRKALIGKQNVVIGKPINLLELSSNAMRIRSRIEKNEFQPGLSVFDDLTLQMAGHWGKFGPAFEELSFFHSYVREGAELIVFRNDELMFSGILDDYACKTDIEKGTEHLHFLSPFSLMQKVGIPAGLFFNGMEWKEAVIACFLPKTIARYFSFDENFSAIKLPNGISFSELTIRSSEIFNGKSAWEILKLLLNAVAGVATYIPLNPLTSIGQLGIVSIISRNEVHQEDVTVLNDTSMVNIKEQRSGISRNQSAVTVKSGGESFTIRNENAGVLFGTENSVNIDLSWLSSSVRARVIGRWLSRYEGLPKREIELTVKLNAFEKLPRVFGRVKLELEIPTGHDVLYDDGNDSGSVTRYDGVAQYNTHPISRFNGYYRIFGVSFDLVADTVQLTLRQ